jgi:hypothetical protein
MIERDDALAAGFVGEGDDLTEQGLASIVAMGEEAHEAGGGGKDGAEGELEQDGASGAAEDDDGGGGLKDLPDVAAFEKEAGEESGEGEENAGEAACIHEATPGG